MAINFTKPMINQLQQEITDITAKIKSVQNNKERSKLKIDQLQKNIQLSKSHNDISNKMTRITKLNAEIKNSNRTQAELSKQLTLKKNSLKKLQVNGE
jgi:predicted RNase H-like nuclease (RuvC/YqgF family)